MIKDPVDSMGHNLKDWIYALSSDFVSAKGDLEERKRLKDAIKEACKILGVTWSKVCEWFRETVRAIEETARTRLEKLHKNKLELFT